MARGTRTAMADFPRRLAGRGDVGALRRFDDAVAGRGDASRVVLLAKRREQPLLQDPPREGVGQTLLEPVADLDAGPAFGRGNQEEHSVVPVLPSQPPLLMRAKRHVLDGLAAQGRDRGDHDLGRALTLELRELGLDRRLSAGIENPSVVVDPRRRLGGNLVRLSRRCEQRAKDDATDQNFTCGAFSAPASAWKNCLAVNPIRRATSDPGKMRIAVL